MKVGAILIPMLGGFLLTAAAISWRSGWWQQRAALDSSAAAAVNVVARRPTLRVVQVHVAEGFPAATPASAPTSIAAAPAATLAAAAPEQESAPYEPPPVSRTDPGNSPERLDASARKFAHGTRADED